MTFEEARAAFPVLKRLAYLNAGTNGPVSRATAEAMVAQTLVDLTEGRAGMGYFTKTRELRERVRGQLAGLIGVPAENVALTTSTTNGCNIVLGGLGLGAGDEVVTTDEEHFGLLGPLHVCGVRVRVAATRGLAPADALDRLLYAVSSKTRLLALSHVSWVTGNELPIAALREQTGLPLLVDGAQSGGAIAVDATPYDYYTVSGQKWPCGPDSTGALYIRDVESLRVCAPTYFSQASFDPDGAFRPSEGAKRFDHGYIGATLLAGLGAAIDAAPEWRFERAREVAARCRTLLSERYEVVTAPDQSTLVAFRPHDEPAAAVERLAAHDVIVREIPASGLVRVSCGYWTSDDDLQRLLEGLTR